LVGKTRAQKTFFDIAIKHKVSKDHILMKINRLINWKPFENKLSKLYHPQIGRPSYPPLMMFKILLLQQWYNLSDLEAEEAIKDRLSFIKFLGLSIEDPFPDETTICRFRNKLFKEGLAETLCKLFNKQLEEKVLLIKKGSLIDATLIKANRKPSSKEREAKDKDAAYTVKKGSASSGN